MEMTKIEDAICGTGKKYTRRHKLGIQYGREASPRMDIMQVRLIVVNSIGQIVRTP